MDEIDKSQIGGLEPQLPDASEPPKKVSRLLLLWPLAGLVTLFAAMIAYRPLDDTLIWWIWFVPCFVVYVLIIIAWRKAQDGRDVRSFLPRTVWLAIGCLCVPVVLLINGVLDHSPIEQHRQTITRTILERRGRRGNFYYAECSSWRGRSHEKLMISYGSYLDWRPGDPIIVETHKGALGIPLLVSIHKPDLNP